jgi:hypothetical protein
MSDIERTEIVFIGGGGVTVDAPPNSVAGALTRKGPGGFAEVVDATGDTILVNREAVAYLMARRSREAQVAWR